MATSLRPRGAILASRFGRRIFAMFCLAALLPAVTVLVIGDRIASRQAEQASERVLRADAKDFAISVYSRLELAAAALASVPIDGTSGRNLAVYFDEVARLDGEDARPAASRLDPRSQRALRALPESVRLAVVPATQGAGRSIVLLRRLPGDGALLAATLKPDFLWGGPDDLRSYVRLCANDGAQRLFCGGAAAFPANGERTRTAEWQLFLKPTFGIGGWTFSAEGLAPQRPRAYTGLLLPVAIGVLLLAVLLSSMQIRRVLVPLDSLLHRIRAFGGVPVAASEVRGKDEFEMLSHTFEGMGARIGQQMEALRMLAMIDRQILAREPLESVIESVLSHVQRIAGATVAIVVVRDAGVECHGRSRNGGDTVVFRLGDMPDVKGDGDAAGDVCVPLQALPPGRLRDWFERCGDSHVRVLSIEHAASTPAPLWVFLGTALGADIVSGALASAGDLAERIAVALVFERHERRLVQQARLDSLTGLPNRLAAYEALGTHIAAAATSGTGFATAFLDLDRFKSINDGLGHAFGDDLLVEIARRIRGAVAAGVFVARLGGDEFFLILPDVTGQADATRAVQRLERAFDRPIVVGQREFQQRFSVGIAFHPADGADAATLIRAADMAMYRVKKAGGSGSAFFDAAMDTAAQERLQMENDLRTAIHERRIALYYQPRVDSRSGRVIGLEALVRWIEPDGRVIPPTEFIGLAEECGLIDELGALVMDEACRQLSIWKAMDLHPPRVGVNVSGHQLDSGALVPTLSATMARWAIEPGCVEIEVTETALVRDSESGSRQLEAVRALGVQVAIDDFGTGYSSLAYLTRLPSDTLKIDRAFVVDLARGDRAAEAVVRSIIGIARDLGKGVVAEGVESIEQVRALDGWGCHTIQGFIYARPLPAEAATRLLAEGGILRPSGPGTG
ncbi:putative bifunctional diguanylate cyclase/phosphodiesterase [Luteimonas notoginsengisoli]|uniref:Bifunctional diguanylate cyclase/phosphodiesterase n=1 Tax=Luteimonas notoginsengisoli TaxID=1578200 RepID=A0ABV7UQI7_9GAMM